MITSVISPESNQEKKKAKGAPEFSLFIEKSYPTTIKFN